MRIDHVQLAIPAGSEALCRPFWLALGFVEAAKPAALQGRGGLWLRRGGAEVHLGVDPDFAPATKAHPGFACDDLDLVARALGGIKAPVVWDATIPGQRRFFTVDPVGNRVEFLASG